MVLGAYVELCRELLPEREIDRSLVEHQCYLITEDKLFHETAGSQYNEQHYQNVYRSWVQLSGDLIWDRRLLFGSSNTMGLAPDKAQDGDIICVPLR